MSRGITLLLIDVQAEFLGDTRLSPPREALMASLRSLLEAARHAGIPVLHLRTELAPDGSDAPALWRRRDRLPCLSGTPGASAPAGLEALSGEAVIIKKGYDAFTGTGLEAALRARGTHTLVLAGTHTHACVRQAAMGAAASGFRVIIAGDSVASYDPRHAALSLEWMEGRVARCLDHAGVTALFAEGCPDPAEKCTHHDPAKTSHELFSFDACPPAEVDDRVRKVAEGRAVRADEPVEQRAGWLAAWHARLSAARADWAAAVARDVGKPLADARAEVEYGLTLLSATLGRVTQEATTGPAGAAHRPVGVLGLITPWNNPFAIPVAKLAAALARGNRVAWKPAPAGTDIARRLVASLGDFLGDRVVIVPGGAATGRALACSSGTDAVSFTGSAAAGRELAALCGGWLKPFQAELGGNNAAIVLADADLDRAAADLATAMFSFAGQRCTAVRRVIVEAPVAGDFRRRLTTAIENLRVGHPLDPTTQVGPVINRASRDRLHQLAESAVHRGATRIAETRLPPDLDPDGAWFAPCLLADVAGHCPSWTEEAFGPVAVWRVARDLEDAICQQNSVRQGLLAALYTVNPAAWHRFRHEAGAGILSLNRARPAFSPERPFAGWKDSGLGPPEHGRWDLEFHSRVQAVYGEEGAP